MSAVSAERPVLVVGVAVVAFPGCQFDRLWCSAACAVVRVADAVAVRAFPVHLSLSFLVLSAFLIEHFIDGSADFVVES